MPAIAVRMYKSPRPAARRIRVWLSNPGRRKEAGSQTAPPQKHSIYICVLRTHLSCLHPHLCSLYFSHWQIRSSMESKAGKKKRSSSSSSDSNHSPALLAVIEDLRPWGSVKWKDPALGDVRFGPFVVLPSLSPASRCPRKLKLPKVALRSRRRRLACSETEHACCARSARRSHPNRTRARH